MQCVSCLVTITAGWLRMATRPSQWKRMGPSRQRKSMVFLRVLVDSESRQEFPESRLFTRLRHFAGDCQGRVSELCFIFVLNSHKLSSDYVMVIWYTSFLFYIFCVIPAFVFVFVESDEIYV